MAKEAKIDYDKENDILYVYKKEKASDSVDFDNFVIDYSGRGMIVGVEIMKASDFISKFGLKRSFLEKASAVSMSVIQGKEYALIKILIASVGGTKEIMVPTPVPQMICCYSGTRK
jgi:uncharacterized protein YuzE